MKSSGAVFTKKNPFQPASSLGKTHYHPTRKQCLSKKKRETTLSPVRSNQPAKPPLDSLSPDEQHHLGKPKQLFTSCLHPSADGRATFSESWPSTDLGSSPPNTNIASNMGTPKPAGKSIVPFVQGDQQDSVVAKYIERFRYGRPQSREERRPMASATEEELLPLWWMSPSSLPPSATPTQATDKDDVILPLRDNHPPVALSPGGQLPHDTSPPTCRASLSILLDTSQGDLDDTEILQLQERASRLLQKSECSASDGSIPISSEGLGCSDFSSPVSVDEPVRKPYIPSLKEPTTGGHSQKSSVTSPLVQHTRPEEDILFQWRLRRKMEKARQWPQCQGYSSHHHSTFSWQNPGVHQPFVSGQPHESIQRPELLQTVTPSFNPVPQKDNKEAHGPCPSATDSPPSPPFPVSSPLVSKLQSGAQKKSGLFTTGELRAIIRRKHKQSRRRRMRRGCPSGSRRNQLGISEIVIVLMGPATQTGTLQVIAEVPKRSHHAQSRRPAEMEVQRRAVRGFPVKAVQAIMHHHLLQSTVS
uniref:Proline and serine rich 3 n=1 Tax=Myripristis murdjan TaxID=586833 RepID=A0A667Z8S4_9TELE